MQRHLCRRTDSLFNVTNRIALFDLTNFYFEGRKEKISVRRIPAGDSAPPGIKKSAAYRLTNPASGGIIKTEVSGG